MGGEPRAEGKGQPGRRAGTTPTKALCLHKVSRAGPLTLTKVSKWFGNGPASPQWCERSEVKLRRPVSKIRSGSASCKDKHKHTHSITQTRTTGIGV